MPEPKPSLTLTTGYGRTVETETATHGGQKPSGKRRRLGLAAQQRVYNLVRVARAFPPEQRDEYADRPWGRFLESVRKRHLQAAAERYASLSIGQIKNLLTKKVCATLAAWV